MEFSEVLGIIRVSSRPLRLRLRPVDGAELCFSTESGQRTLVDTGFAVRTISAFKLHLITQQCGQLVECATAHCWRRVRRRESRECTNLSRQGLARQLSGFGENTIIQSPRASTCFRASAAKKVSAPIMVRVSLLRHELRSGEAAANALQVRRWG